SLGTEAPTAAVATRTTQQVVPLHQEVQGEECGLVQWRPRPLGDDLQIGQCIGVSLGREPCLVDGDLILLTTDGREGLVPGDANALDAVRAAHGTGTSLPAE